MTKCCFYCCPFLISTAHISPCSFLAADIFSPDLHFILILSAVVPFSCTCDLEISHTLGVFCHWMLLMFQPRDMSMPKKPWIVLLVWTGRHATKKAWGNQVYFLLVTLRFIVCLNIISSIPFIKLLLKSFFFWKVRLIRTHDQTQWCGGGLMMGTLQIVHRMQI